eukprot:TRINITY_DN11587_c0_g1_i1.p1 TRINITY_DN11587_c0_g1~~TRINITY_DN11587_c0_g1_i1.p1  ORF type:complete len:143 (+),score=55.08 TRINITY_DN11587_c0_g1_i1:163-591(+)
MCIRDRHQQLVLAKAYTEAQIQQLRDALETQKQEVIHKEKEVEALVIELAQQGEAYQAAAGSGTAGRGQHFAGKMLMSIGSARLKHCEPGLTDSINQLWGVADGLMKPGVPAEEGEGEVSVVELDAMPEPPILTEGEAESSK